MDEKDELKLFRVEETDPTKQGLKHTFDDFEDGDYTKSKRPIQQNKD